MRAKKMRQDDVAEFISASYSQKIRYAARSLCGLVLLGQVHLAQQGGLHPIRDAVGELVLDAAAAARPAINSSVGGAKLQGICRQRGVRKCAKAQRRICPLPSRSHRSACTDRCSLSPASTRSRRGGRRRGGRGRPRSVAISFALSSQSPFRASLI